MPIEFKNQHDLEKFLPSEKAIRLMHARYPIHGTFIMDMMSTPNTAAGWFLAGYIFGQDKELRGMGFEDTFALLEAGGVQRMMYDA